MIVAILLVGTAAHYFLIATMETSWPAIVALFASVLGAGIAAGRFAPRMKLLVGAAVALPAAVLVGAADLVFGISGHYSSGWPGPMNSILAAIVVLPIGAIVGLVGGAAGAIWAGRGADA